MPPGRAVVVDGVLATVEDADGDLGGSIRAMVGGKLLTRSGWAIVLSGI
jgi:hypothetical protein